MDSQLADTVAACRDLVALRGDEPEFGAVDMPLGHSRAVTRSAPKVDCKPLRDLLPGCWLRAVISERSDRW